MLKKRFLLFFLVMASVIPFVMAAEPTAQSVSVSYDEKAFATTGNILMDQNCGGGTISYDIILIGKPFIAGDVKVKAVAGTACTWVDKFSYTDAITGIASTPTSVSKTLCFSTGTYTKESIVGNVLNKTVSKINLNTCTSYGETETFTLSFQSKFYDIDLDGYFTDEDCADNDPTIYPGAPEICDGKANNQAWNEDMTHCEAAGITDAGCDNDFDDFCDSAMNVSLSWLSTCTIDMGEGCCSKTWQWYKEATGTLSGATEVHGVYSKLYEYDKKLFRTTTKTVVGVATYFARGNDCSDGSKAINPGATEICYSDNDNVADDDCDDGTNIVKEGAATVTYKHWDVDITTGVNEGCEDDNTQDCERYKHYWIGGIDNAGSCCGNNTYALTTGAGNKKATEFFPYWDTLMAAYPTSYDYSGCWDSLPLQNDETSAANLLWASIPEAPVLAQGREYYYATVSNEGEINLTEEAVNVTKFEPDGTNAVYTLRMNVSLDSDQPTIAKLRYMEGRPSASGMIWSAWTDAGYFGQVMSNKGWKIKGFDYPPPSNQVPPTLLSADVKQIKLQMYLIGGGTLKIKDASFYNAKDKKILNVNGTFRGCDVPGNSWVTLQVNTYDANPVPVILPQYYTTHDAASPDNCSTASDYYCSYAGYWKKNVDRIEPNKVSNIPAPAEVIHDPSYWESFYMDKECCPVGYCWDGIKCNNGNFKFIGVNLANLTVDEVVYNYKCVDGSWQTAALKADQDNLTTGYCGELQCLYKPLDGSARLCVNDKNYTFDDYCLQGQWTSRTNLIATQLIDLVQKDSGSMEYTLFCDSFKDALNDYDYRDLEAGDVLDYLLGINSGDEESPAFDCGFGEFGCTNNFCVLKYTDNSNKEKVVFGTSLNLPINVSKDDPRSTLSFLRLINALTRNIVPDSADHYTYCDGVIRQQKDYYLGCTHKLGDKDYVEDQDWDLWYNAKTQSMIYSPQKINLGSYNFWSSFVSFIKAPFTRIINFILGMEREGYAGDDYALVNDLGKFRKLYLNDDYSGGGYRSIKGVIEKVGVETAMVVDYYLVGADICRKVDDYNKKQIDTGCDISSTLCPLRCEPAIYSTDDWSFHVESMNDDGMMLWPELTAKIRLNGTVQAPETAGSGGLKIDVS